MTKPRFFMDHGVIHDRVSGKHIVTDGVFPFDDTPEMICDLLNLSASPLSDKDVTNLQQRERAKTLAVRLDEALGLVVASPDGADIYLGDLIVMGAEISDLLRDVAGLPALGR